MTGRPNDLEVIHQWAKGDEIVLDNVPMHVEGGIGYQLTNVYPRPERSGEPQPADHPYNATHTQRTWVQGQLRRDLIEPADVGVYWDGLAWTFTRGKLGARLKVVKIPEPVGWPGGMVTPHKRVGHNMIYTAGNINGKIYEYRAVDGQLHNPGGGGEVIFFGTVKNKGVVFRTEGTVPSTIDSWLYIPTTAGYTRMSTATNEVKYAPDAHAIDTVGMAIHENKLYRLLSTGVVESIIHHDDDWLPIATIPDGSEPRNIYETYDDDGNRVIGVTTSSGLFLLDHDNGILWMTDLRYPEHAYQGYAAVQWRADDWISVGVGIHRRVGGLVTPEGLDNYDGLPESLAGGFICDGCASYNWLVMAVAGTINPGEINEFPPPEGEKVGVTEGLPYPIVIGGPGSTNLIGTNRMGALFAWNGMGWGKLHQWNRPPTRVEVTMIMNATREERQQHLFFGDYDGGAYLIQIPSDYYNPLFSPGLPLEREWTLEESRIDWNAPDTPKLAKQLNFKVDHLWHQMKDPAGQPHPYYNEIDVVLNWRDLDGITHTSEDAEVLGGPGPYPFIDQNNTPTGRLTLAVIPEHDAANTPWLSNSRRSNTVGWEWYGSSLGVRELLATGLPHESIWLTYYGKNDVRAGNPNFPDEINRAPQPLTTGLLEWRTIIVRKWMRPNRVWTFVIDAATAIKGESQEDVLAILDGICLKVGGVPLVIGDRMYIVDVTRLDGANETGLSPQAKRTITCLEFTDVTYEDSIPPVK